MLANPRRRFVVAYLSDRSEPVSVAALADELTRLECNTPENHVLRRQVESRHIDLHHVHLPKLAEAGIIEFNEEQQTVIGLSTRDQ